MRWLAVALLLVLPASHAPAEPLTPTAVNGATFAGKAGKTSSGRSAVLLKAQVLLDRKGFSPGVIDARGGDNTEKAIRAFQKSAELEETGKLDRATWDALTAEAGGPVLIEYELTKDDVSGPFSPKIPGKLEAQAKLKGLHYRHARERLAEKFHLDEDLLKALNKGRRFDRAGERIVVANVGRPDTRKGEVTRIVVDKSEGSLRALRKDGSLAAFYPATVGSERNPAPSGTYKITRIAENPTYHYRPSLEFKGVKTDKPFTVAAGPNNPVGLVWIDLNKKGYGIHGTPDPALIGKTASHGCVRLTNWDAKHLAAMVKAGTPVEFLD